MSRSSRCRTSLAAGRIPWLAGLLVLIVAIGCSKARNTHNTARVAGSISIGGAPLAEGRMQFMPLGHGQSATAEIKQGSYTAENVPLGKVRVLIYANRKNGKTHREYDQVIEDVDNLVPAKHRNGIDIEVTADKDNQDFNL